MLLLLLGSQCRKSEKELGVRVGVGVGILEILEAGFGFGVNILEIPGVKVGS